MLKGSYQLFVSYARDDNDKDYISEFILDLIGIYKKHTGGDELTVFMDTEGIVTSDIWVEKIQFGLSNSLVMLSFLSPSYFKSKWCSKEWDYFFTKKDKLIFPIKIYGWEHLQGLSGKQRNRIKQANKFQYSDFEHLKKQDERYYDLLKKLSANIYDKLKVLEITPIEANNVHILCKNIDQVIYKDTRADNINDIKDKIQKEKRMYQQQPVCVIYTGGTVGMVRSEPEDKKSILEAGTVDDLVDHLVRLYDLEFDIDFHSFCNPLDSSNIRDEDWIRIAEIIYAFYDYYQGFVVLHGTDTMAYTSSSLSFMFDNLRKPVILTGAERPISEPGNDAEINIIRAIQAAAPKSSVDVHNIPEVCILFGKKLIRGNRAKKIASLDFEGFDSPNCNPLGKIEDTIDIYQREIIKPYGDSQQNPFSINTELENGVFIIEVFPDMNIDIFSYMLKSKNIKAAILKTYGTGNAPTIPEYFLKAIKEAIDMGKIIVNLTQCPKGNVEVRLFETSSHLFDLGVVNGGDMTSEAAYAKLKWLLGRYKNPDNSIDTESVKHDLQVDLKGELRFSAYAMTYKRGLINPIFYGEQKQFAISENEEIDHAFLRIQGVAFDNATGKAKIGIKGNVVKLRVYFDRPRISVKEEERDFEYRIGLISRDWEGKELTHNLDATETVRRLLRPRQLVSLQVVSENNECIKFETLELSVFTRRR